MSHPRGNGQNTGGLCEARAAVRAPSQSGARADIRDVVSSVQKDRVSLQNCGDFCGDYCIQLAALT